MSNVRNAIRGKALIIWDKSGLKKMDSIDTDQITPASFCVSESLEQIDKWWKEGAFKYLIPDFRKHIHNGETFIIAGDYFGIGSSREMSPAGLKAIADEAGLELVIICGNYIGDIFYKNALNLGLKVISIPAAANDAKDDDEFELRENALVNLTQNKFYDIKLPKHDGIFNIGRKEFSAINKVQNKTQKNIEWADASLADNLTVTEQILYAHRVDKDARLNVGSTIKVWADLLPASEVSAPFAIYTFNKIIGDTSCCGKVSRPINPAIVCDHFVFTDLKEDKNQLQISYDFAKLYGLKEPFFVEPGKGIFHIYFPEQGLIQPGGFYAGADSHTRTYGAYGALAIGVGSTTLGFGWANGYIYFTIPEQTLVILKGKLLPWTTGKDIALALLKRWEAKVQNMSVEFVDEDLQLPMHYRHTISNMMAEAEAICSIFIPDSITHKWFKDRNIDCQYPYLSPGKNASYFSCETIDISDIGSQVAVPFHPKNSVNAYELSKDRIAINKAFIGSCTNGNYEDILEAAQIFYLLKLQLGIEHIANSVELIVFPGSAKIRSKMENKEPSLGEKSIREVLESVGGKIRESWCGPCMGKGPDALRNGEKAITTFNRNWKNRMGVGGESYLASPIVVAASSIAGYICSPDELGLKYDKFHL